MKSLITVITSLLMAGVIHTFAQTVQDDIPAEVLANLPKVSPYFFQHQYLSVVAEEIDYQDGDLLADPYVLNSFSPPRNGFLSPFDDEDIQISVIEKDGKKVYVWKFPESSYLREALYMAFFPVDNHYRAYSICIGQMVDWEISTSKSNSRSCYGQVKKPESAAECVDLLTQRGAFSGTITPGVFLVEGYQTPSYRN